MKKIILILMLVTGLNADSLKENQQACDDGNIIGCFNLGIMYDAGTGVKQDYFKAGKLYKQACDGNYVQACTNLGAYYYNGDGVKQSRSKAKKFFGKACDGGDAMGCKNYAILNKK